VGIAVGSAFASAGAAWLFCNEREILSEVDCWEGFDVVLI
jgi:hypothetical protein